MTEIQVPIINSPRPIPMRLSIWGRLTALVVALGCLSMLVIGAWLTPSPAGVGTHTEMKLDSCAFLLLTHIPCPTCGMTTSTSWFVRGNFLASFYVQPMGFVIALCVALLFWGSLYIGITGRPSHRLLQRLPMQKILFGFLFFAILAWGWKIFIHTHGIDGWR